MSPTNMAAMTSHENTPLYRVTFHDVDRIQLSGMLFLMVQAKAPLYETGTKSIRDDLVSVIVYYL